MWSELWCYVATSHTLNFYGATELNSVKRLEKCYFIVWLYISECNNIKTNAKDFTKACLFICLAVFFNCLRYKPVPSRGWLWMMKQKGCRRNLSWYTTRYRPSSFLDWLKKEKTILYGFSSGSNIEFTSWKRSEKLTAAPILKSTSVIHVWGLLKCVLYEV